MGRPKIVRIGVLKPPTILVRYDSNEYELNTGDLEELVYEYMEKIRFQPVRYRRKKIGNTSIIYVRMEPVSLDSP